MKKSLSLLVTMGFLLVLSSGCATRDYVRQQMEPIVDRLSKLEAQSKECCENAKKCCDNAKECCENAEGAAKRAEAAAKRAETAAEKSTKSFELQQRK